MERKDKLRNLIQSLHDGMSQEEARAIFKREFGKISGEELAAAEQALANEGMPVSEIQRLCDVHASVFEDSILFIPKPEQKAARPLSETPGHPAFVFRQENAGIQRFLDEIFQPALTKLEENGERGELQAAARETAKITLHYKRKENLFFPFLEREGILMPPKVMWGVDDEIRGTLAELQTALEGTDEAAIITLAQKLSADIRAMLVKENNILMPMLLEKLKDEDWVLIARDSPEIGYVFTGGSEGASPSDANTWYQAQQGGQSDLAVAEPGAIQLGSGSFSAHELEAVLNSLPCDLTFVGSDDKVHYFSEGKNRVFPRTRSIIGRAVTNCHPPKSLHVVEQLVADFKAGLKDEENFWIQKDGLFILIRYFAVRDAAGKYLGIVEVTEEIAGLRSLEGSKTLLSD